MGNFQSKNNLGLSKKERFKLTLAILGFFLVVSVFFTVSTFQKDLKAENLKDQTIVHVDDDAIIDYRNEFKYEPNYDHFFEVEDQLDDTPIPLSEGELKILEFVGSLMHRVHPKLVQSNSKIVAYETIRQNSNMSKGQVINVVGKIIKIRKFKKIDQIRSAQFVNSFVIETVDGGVFDLRVAVAEPSYKLGDVVFGAGIYLKLNAVSDIEKPCAVVLANQALLLFRSPVMWRNETRYKEEVKEQLDSFSKLLVLPEANRFETLKAVYTEKSKADYKLWDLIDDDDPEKSRKIPEEVEIKLIKQLGEVPDEYLVNNAEIVTDYKKLLGSTQKLRGQEVCVIGKLDSIVRAVTDSGTISVSSVYYSKIIDLKGDVYYFNFIRPTFIDEDDRIDLKDSLVPVKGELVACMGVFFQKTNDVESKAWAPVVYGKKLAVIGTYENIWDSVSQGDERTALNDYGGNKHREAGMVEPMPFSYLLGKVSYSTSANIVNSYYSQKEEDRLTFAKMMNAPQDHFDAPYVIFGKLMQIKQIEGPHNYLFHGVKRVYEYYFVDRDNHLYTFISLNRPEGVYKSKRMTFAGYFMKRFAYKNRDGKIQWTPFMVGNIHELEKMETKELTRTEWAILIFLMLSVVYAFVRINKQSAKNKERINELRNRQIRRNKIDREKVKELENTGGELDQPIILPFHILYQENHKLTYEVCGLEKDWVQKNDRNTQWRPEYLNSAVTTIEEHFKNFESALPKDIENNFINKRKEMLGLRPYQNSKFTLPLDEKKRKSAFIMIPAKSFKGKVHDGSLNGYFDEYGMPPWLTWVYFGNLPKYVFKDASMNYKPNQQVVIAWVPEFLSEDLLAKFKVLNLN